MSTQHAFSKEYVGWDVPINEALQSELKPSVVAFSVSRGSDREN